MLFRKDESSDEDTNKSKEKDLDDSKSKTNRKGKPTRHLNGAKIINGKIDVFDRMASRETDFRNLSIRKRLYGEDKTPGPSNYRPKQVAKPGPKVWRLFSKDTGRDYPRERIENGYLNPEVP